MSWARSGEEVTDHSSEVTNKSDSNPPTQVPIDSTQEAVSANAPAGFPHPADDLPNAVQIQSARLTSDASASTPACRGLGHFWWLLPMALYAATALVIFRLNFATNGFPAGTNTLDEYVSIYQIHKFGLGTLWYSLTDWGQPYPGFTGPTFLWPLKAYLSPGLGTRVLEFSMFVLAGISGLLVTWRISLSRVSASVCGFYYMVMVQTGQFFEGHIGIMVSFAVAPLFFYFVYVTFSRPTLKNSAFTAVLLFVLGSDGDLGALYMCLFFGTVIGLFAISVRFGRNRYSLNEILSILFGIALLFLLVSPWLFPFVGGLRPEYTTNVTANTVSFGQTSGASLFHAYIGYIQDASYTLYTYGQPDYSLLPVPLEISYLFVPVWVMLYVILTRNWKVQFAYLGALFSIMVSTGNVYPLAQGVNGWLYSNIPLFNASPSLFRWTFFTIFVYTVILSLAIRDSGQWIHQISHTLIPNRGSHSKKLAARFQLSGRAKSTALMSGVAILVVSLVIMQNGEVFTEPPTTFQFPSAETEAYSYVASQASRGLILTIPFGDTGSRSSWGGVSQSSIFMSPYLSGVGTVMFQAGTPDSLAIDWFVGNGLTNGLSNNMTKFLAASNIQYIIATKFQNWSYASDPIYYPPLSYYALQNQTGLGTPVFFNGNQTVYEVSDYSGNVSYSSTYYVYYGDSHLLYSVLNAPWYRGAETPLINGSLLGSQTDSVDSHASAILVSPTTLSSLSYQLLSALARAKVPISVITNSPDLSDSPDVSEVRQPWISSNGMAFTQTDGPLALLPPQQFSELAASGYVSVEASGRALIPPFTGGYFEVGEKSIPFTSSNPVKSLKTLPWTNLSLVSAGINNQGKYPYNGSVKLTNLSGELYLEWQFAPNNSTYQSVNLRVSNLSGLTGLVLNIRGQAPSNMLTQVLFNHTFMNVYGRSTFYPVVNSSTVAFDFTSGSNSSGLNFADFEKYSNNVSLLAIGLPKSGASGTIYLNNITGFAAESATSSYTYQSFFDETPFTGGNYSLVSTPGDLYDFIQTTFLPENFSSRSEDFASDFETQDGSDQLNVNLTTNGWGVIVADQTWNSVWDLNSPAVALSPIRVNIGLTGWVINFSGPIRGTISLAVSNLYTTGLVVEAIGVPLLIAVPVGYLRVRTAPKR